MDLQTLSQQLVTSLAPFLPYLLKMGEKAAEEAGEKFGAEAWEGPNPPPKKPPRRPPPNEDGGAKCPYPRMN